jgi:hypothetical protein
MMIKAAIAAFALAGLASAAFVPMKQQHAGGAHNDTEEVPYVAPDCICAGVVPACADAALINQAMDTLLLNNCQIGNACAMNPTCR